MKKIYFPFFIIMLSIWMAGCKSASKLYDKGNYDEAVQVAVKKLQKDPNNSKLRSVVQDAYRYAVTGHENKIHSYSENDNELKWEWMYNEYAGLQNLYNTIFKSPTAFELVHPTDYSSYANTYAAKAADVHYNHGMQWMNNHDKQSYKKAYHEFQAASGFKPGDVNVQQMLSEAYEAAITRVVVLPADDYGFRYSSYNYQLRNFETDIIHNLQYNTSNEFVKFYSSGDAQRLNTAPDEFVEMHFTQLNLGQIKDNYSTREVSQEVVIKETVYKPDSVIKQYALIKAKITTTQRIINSEGNLSISIRNNNGLRLWNDNVINNHSWSTEFSSYTGDERALSDEDKKLLNKTRENPPREEEIISCVKEGIYNDFLNKIRNYYSHY
jgi:hypothetical protein